MKSVFEESLEIDASTLTLDSEFELVSGWDSLGHLKIISEIEYRLDLEFEIDEMAADFINDKLYEAAKIRVMYKESGFKYYYTLGLIEESQKNYSTAKMYYSEGELNTDQFDQKEVFSDSIARIESRNKN